MARALRITFPGAFYHVTSRENERKAFLKSKRECNWFSPRMARNIKIYLSQKHIGKKLKQIGLHFGIGKPGVSRTSRRLARKIEKDKKLKKKIVRLQEPINKSRMKT